jgi:hypothetical protein
MNWDLTFKAIGVITTTVVGLYQWRSVRFRSQLKNDLEILKLYQDVRGENKYCQSLRRRIDETITKRYEDKGPINSSASFLYGLSLLFICVCLYIFYLNGVSPMLFVLFLISIGLAIVSFRRLRD